MSSPRTETSTIVPDPGLAALPPERESGFGALRSTRGALPLELLDVQARVAGLVVETQLTQRFVNVHDEPLEVTYIFPLPPGAAVVRFRATIGGQRLAGKVRERERARLIYDEAIEAGKSAAIVEEERPDVFTLRAGNLPAGASAEIELTTVDRLVIEDDEASFRFPLVVAPRYIPGTPSSDAPVGLGTARDTGAVVDASRITPPVLLPGFASPVHLSLRVKLRASAVASPVRGSLHDLIVGEENGWLVVSLAPGAAPDRDLILRWHMPEEPCGLFVVPDEGDDSGQGTWLLHVAPPPLPGHSVVQGRDVVVLLDCSGSMQGWKMAAARETAAQLIEAASDSDRIAVAAFDNQLSILRDSRGQQGLRLADEDNRHALAMAIRAIQARGGTEILSALDWATDLLCAEASQREAICLLITDGQVGNDDQLLERLGPRFNRVRLYCIGIDQAPNVGLLSRLAERSGGAFEVVESEPRLREVMDRIRALIRPALLTDLMIDITGSAPDAQASARTPERLPNLVSTKPLVVLGRYRGAEPRIRARVAGTRPDGTSMEMSLEGEQIDLPALPRVWARSRLRALEDRYIGSWERQLERQIVDLSLKWQVLSRFTAWVAVAADASVTSDKAGPRAVIQPVSWPSGWAANMALGSVEGQLKSQSRGMRTQSGVLRVRPSHLSPEMAKGQSFDVRSDVFILGVLLWELLCGRPMFQGRTEIDTLRAIIEGKLPEPLLSGELEVLEPLLGSMLHLDPGQRPLPSALCDPIGHLLDRCWGPSLAEIAGQPPFGEPAGIAAHVAADPPADLDDDEIRLAGQLAAGQLADVSMGWARIDGRATRVAVELLLPHFVEDNKVADMFLAVAGRPHAAFVETFEVGRTPDDRVYRLRELLRGREVLAGRGSGHRQGWAMPPYAAVELALHIASMLVAFESLGGSLRLDPRDVFLAVNGDVRMLSTLLAPMPEYLPRRGNRRIGPASPDLRAVP